ncbi:MAG: site-specific integrase, partial [Edaphocola sp.]
MQTYYFFEEMQTLIDGMQNKTILTPDGDYYNASSIRNWKSKMNGFRDYIHGDMPLDEINLKWCQDYQLYLLHDGYAKNTIGNILSVLKAFVRRMHGEGKMTYDGFGIRAGGEITTAVFTDIPTIKAMVALDLGQTAGMGRIRDVYVCQCFLGLRVADTLKFLANIKAYAKAVNGVALFEVPTNKTGEVVAIPASKIVLAICERRNYDFGGKFSQQYYYETIKA